MKRWIIMRIVLLPALVFSLSGVSAQEQPAPLPTETLTVLADVEGADIASQAPM